MHSALEDRKREEKGSEMVQRIGRADLKLHPCMYQTAVILVAVQGLYINHTVAIQWPYSSRTVAQKGHTRRGSCVISPEHNDHSYVDQLGGNSWLCLSGKGMTTVHVHVSLIGFENRGLMEAEIPFQCYSSQHLLLVLKSASR